jgi:hypothetical protein
MVVSFGPAKVQAMAEGFADPSGRCDDAEATTEDLGAISQCGDATKTGGTRIER